MQQLERVTNLLALLLTTRRHLTFEEIRQEMKGQYPENLAAARAEIVQKVYDQFHIQIEQEPLEMSV